MNNSAIALFLTVEFTVDSISQRFNSFPLVVRLYARPLMTSTSDRVKSTRLVKRLEVKSFFRKGITLSRVGATKFFFAAVA